MAFQLGASLLDACVLAVLSKCDAYGYSLTQTLRSVMDISESTLYPVLRRLQKDGALITYDRPYQGRNRRYYAITVFGRKQYAAYQEEWKAYKENLDKILIGGLQQDE